MSEIADLIKVMQEQMQRQEERHQQQEERHQQQEERHRQQLTVMQRNWMNNANLQEPLHLRNRHLRFQPLIQQLNCGRTICYVSIICKCKFSAWR